MTRRNIAIILFSVLIALVSCEKEPKDYWNLGDGGTGGNGGEEVEKPKPVKPADKPRYIWVDASANFPDFANSKENIARDIALAKDAGFTDLVVDVRPTTGDVLFKTSVVDQVKYQYAWQGGQYSRFDRTATWDYLQAFIDEARKQDIRIHAAINTFVGGNAIDGGTGLLHRDASKKSWATSLNTAAGVRNIMDTGESTKFFNPAHPEVQTFLCNLLKDLAKYDLDGIILDRGRYLNLLTDFSDESRRQFEEYLGVEKVQNWPGDVLPAGHKDLSLPNTVYIDEWMEFRAKVIHDFIVKAREAVKSVNSEIKFGVYVGGWYAQYYDVGVNWAAPTYDASRYYKWAPKKYKDFGYADHLDQLLIGAYASPLSVYGTSEWTMQGFCALAMDKTKGACPIVAGGPDVGNWDANDNATQEQENQAIVNSVKACMDVCNGYFLFDMIHLKLADQWKYAKEGIRKAIQ